MAASGLHISISAETLFTIGNLDVTNSMFTSVIVSFILILFALIVKIKLDNKTSKPAGLQNFAEMIVEALYGLTHGVTGNLKKTRLFFPFIGSFFLVILLNNWFGLIPGVGTIRIEAPAETEHASIIESAHAAEEVVDEEETVVHTEEELILEDDHAEVVTTDEHLETAETGHGEEVKYVPIFRPGTADLNTTLAFALVSVFVTQVVGVKALKLSYFKKYINFSSPIMFFVGILEIVSEFAKIISFAFRLFGNIFAGEVLLVVMTFLVPIIVPMPFYGLEIFVGFIQALVFAMLSLVFFNMATISHDEH